MKSVSAIFLVIVAFALPLPAAESPVAKSPAARPSMPEPPVTRITVDLNKPGARISPTLYGIFFEDINFAADGGLYPELVKNRSFEFPDAMMGWREIRPAGAAGSISIEDQGGFSAANPHYLRLKVATDGKGFGVSNEGFRGMGVREGEKYRFSAQARTLDGGPLALRLEVVAKDGRKVAEGRVDCVPSQWQPISATLLALATEPKSRLNIIVEGAGTIDLDMVSLFPEHTWKNRPNGLRADLVQLLADLKPAFVRFPGGCIVEGHTLANRYQWKTTIGPLEERKLILNRWNDEFKPRSTPDYFQSFGLGFFEYFQLCEDIGAEPLPILNCGMACQYNSGELAPLDQLDPYIQDALDLVEFANGPATSRWGAKRAEMGHAEPFRMKYLGVGNEQWGKQYLERYERFAKVLKQKHPEIRLVSSAGPGPGGANFDLAWKRLRTLNADLVDEHCYSNPGWFFSAATRYDKYDRKGPKVFMGEYATHCRGNTNNWEAALSEAAFMTGLERNGDVVAMSSYAPLLAHADAWQWQVDLIWFDNLRTYTTPNYHVQKLFSTNRGDVALHAETTSKSIYMVAGRIDATGEVVLKLVNAADHPVTADIDLRGAKKVAAAASVTVLSSDNLSGVNSFAEPAKIAPVASQTPITGPQFKQPLPKWSVTVLRVKAE
jgi:alpha-L-arabinofuranosidase